MSVENSHRDDETTVLPVADEEETTILPAADVDATMVSSGSGSVVTDEVDTAAEDAVEVAEALEEDVDKVTDQVTDESVPSGSAPVDAMSAGEPSTVSASGEAGATTPKVDTPPAAAPAASGAASAAPVSSGVGAVQEAPANGVRVAQLVWAGMVMMLGIFMIAISFLRFVSIPLLAISLIAALGIALMAAAVVTSVKKG